MSYGTAVRMLAFYQSTADSDGVFGINTPAVAERFQIKPNSVGEVVRRLMFSGAIIRIGLGKYRLTGQPHVTQKPAKFHRVTSSPPLAMDDDTPTAPDTYSGGAPCTYATARACGIEPVTYLRKHVQDSNVVTRAVTLARIPCLERPLPREAA